METYANWEGKSREGTWAAVDTRLLQPISELQTDVSRFKRGLVIAGEERDILKKPPRALRNSPSEVRVY